MKGSDAACNEDFCGQEELNEEKLRTKTFCLLTPALMGDPFTTRSRHLHPGEKIYTFWDYFRNAYARNAGLRIDHLLLSPQLAGRLAAAGVDRDAQATRRRLGSRSRARSELPGRSPCISFDPYKSTTPKQWP